MASDIEIEFDPVKDVKNRGKHRVSLASAAVFEWDSAQVDEDVRRPYPERRFVATGWLDGVLHELVFCLHDSAIRVISLRKSNRREIKKHEDQNQIG